ncbi:hypothetical protein [Methylobacterium sp. JK268]
MILAPLLAPLLAPFLAFATALGPAADRTAALAREGLAAGTAWEQALVRAAGPEAAGGPPLYEAGARAVSNWRGETRRGLRPVSLALVAFAAPEDPAFVARCVKLNNYWCIKRAGWDGEIGADAEGHTGFASAARGADAAVSLLRRYYTQLGRRSALAVVRRWAPAECGAPVAIARRPDAAGRPEVAGRPGAAAPPRPAARPAIPASPALAALAPKGIGRTLRARFLAGHGRGGVVRAPAPRTRIARPAPPGTAAPASRAGGPALRVQPWSALARLAGRSRGGARPVAAARVTPTPRATPAKRVASAPVPTIATGIGVAEGGGPPPAAPVSPARVLDGDRLLAEAASLPSLTALAALPSALRPPAPLCSSDEARIQAYAHRIAASVGVGASEDLGLFDAEGRATARLAPVLLAMSAVELGSLRADPALVAAAIARAEAARSAESARAEAASLPTPHRP